MHGSIYNKVQMLGCFSNEPCLIFESSKLCGREVGNQFASFWSKWISFSLQLFFSQDNRKVHSRGPLRGIASVVRTQQHAENGAFYVGARGEESCACSHSSKSVQADGEVDTLR